MLGTLITVGIGAYVFKKGMNAQKMLSDGYNVCEVAKETLLSPCGDAREAYDWCVKHLNSEKQHGQPSETADQTTRSPS